MRTNGDMSRGFETIISEKKKHSNKIVFLHGLTEEFKLSLLIMEMEYAPAARKGCCVYLSKHRAAKCRK